MSPQYVLRMTGLQYIQLKDHLFPADGYEAIALLICGRRKGKSRHVMAVREVISIPYEQCLERRADCVRWSTELLTLALEKYYGKGFAVVKVHSHRMEYRRFSPTDDISDRELFAAVEGYLADGLPHASAIMLPNGEMFGRVVEADGQILPFSTISVVGDDLLFWTQKPPISVGSFALRQAQAFGDETTQRLRRLKIGIVGCSGTGSFVIEQLARLGVGKLVLVDPDHIEEKNLNRIVNASKNDSYLGSKKVFVLASAIARIGLDQEVFPLATNLATREAILAIAECDVVFGCMDGAEGRHLLNRIATFYNLPYFDVGVRLEADGSGGIAGISSASHYLQPGQSSLFSREVYKMSNVEAEELRRTSPELYEQRRKEGYIRNVEVDRPAVISVNAMAAAVVVNDFLARLHPYRNSPNRNFACIRLNFAEMQFFPEEETTVCQLLERHVGRGDVEPLLDRPSIP